MNIKRIKQATEYLRKTRPYNFNQLSWCNCFAHHAAILFGLTAPGSGDNEYSEPVNDLVEILELNGEDKETLFYGVHLYRYEIQLLAGSFSASQRIDYHNFLHDPVRIADAIDKYVNDQEEKRNEPT